MLKLRAHGLSVENILQTDDATLDGLIHAVGFHNNKVKYIKAASLILKEQHGGRVPSTMADPDPNPDPNPNPNPDLDPNPDPSPNLHQAAACHAPWRSSWRCPGWGPRWRSL